MCLAEPKRSWCLIGVLAEPLQESTAEITKPRRICSWCGAAMEAKTPFFTQPTMVQRVEGEEGQMGLFLDEENREER